MNFPFFFKDSPDEQILQFVRDCVSFSEITKIDFKFPLTLKSCKQFFDSQISAFYDRLHQWVDSNDTQEFHESTIDLLEQDSKLPAQAQKLLEKCKDSVLKFRNSKKLLVKMVEVLENSDSGDRSEAVWRVGVTFEKEGYLRQAARVFRLLGCPGDYLRCFDKIGVDNESSAQEHISYLA